MKKTILKRILTVGIISAIFLVASLYIFVYTTKDSVEVDFWLTTTEDDGLRLSRQDALSLKPSIDLGSSIIRVNDEKSYQEMQGFGAALTDSSAWLIHEVLNSTEYQKIMEALFDPEKGIGISYLRLPLGASDCALSFYSYLDNSNDLNDFSIKHDESYIIPLLQDALELNPELKLIGSPWSAPGGMKKNNNLTDPSSLGLIGGTLREDMYETYAHYFVKIIEAYNDHNIEFDAITIQNEQFFVPASYPGMSLNENQTIDFIKILGEEFEKNSITTKIFILDHNWVYYNEVLEILSDDIVRDYVDGIAWHGYEDIRPDYQSIVKEQYPVLSHYFTEVSGLWDYTSFPHNLEWTFKNIYSGTIRNWAESVMLWNIALDQNGEPILHESGVLRGVLTIPREENQQIAPVIYEGEYYMIGHFSKFIKSGAVRIDSNQINGIDSVAFKNVDGSIVVVLCNIVDEPISFSLTWDFRSFDLQLPARSLATFIWR